MKYYLAVDIGASSGRHIVGWRENGEIRTEEVYRFPNGVTELDGHLIWDIDALASHVKTGIEKAKEEYSEIESLSIDTWGVDYVLMKGDEEVRPCYAYRDSRTEAVIPAVHAVFTIAVPTTAGTAAEVTINYVITDVEKKRKFVCVDVNDIPEVAIVDPEMMYSMPKPLTAATGMEALTHAIEGYITKGHCAISDMFHLEAIRLIAKNLRAAVENDEAGREGMALGQYSAGMGFSNVGLGIVHSMAHGLSALYDTPHGVACAILLPLGLEYNAPVSGERYRAIGKAMEVPYIDSMNDEDAARATIAAVRKLGADVGIPADLKEIVRDEDVQFLAESAFADACCPGNPRDTSVEEIAALYSSLM